MTRPFAPDAMPGDHFDRRHEEEALGVWVGRRHYPLSRIGKGLLLTASIAGVVGGCFAWGMGVAGKRLVDADDDFRRQSVYNDSVSMLQRANLDARLARVELQLSIVGLVQCTQLSPQAPEWVRDECRDVLNQGRPLK